MTTFQILIESFLTALTTVLPVSTSSVSALTRGLLEWSVPVDAIELLILGTASLVLLFFFRYDWLGLLSAGITSLVRPMSLRNDARSLDQHTLLFLLIAFLPVEGIKLLAGSPLPLPDFIPATLLSGMGLVLTGLAFFASSRWNKRIHGLNHLRLSHALIIALAGSFSLIPGFPPVGLLWIAFAFCNYHFESICKFSGILIALQIFVRMIEMLQNQTVREALEKIGYLNSAAVLVIGFTVIWISLENLQKSFSESTFRNFQWLSLFTGSAMIALFFMGKLQE